MTNLCRYNNKDFTSILCVLINKNAAWNLHSAAKNLPRQKYNF